MKHLRLRALLEPFRYVDNVTAGVIARELVDRMGASRVEGVEDVVTFEGSQYLRIQLFIESGRLENYLLELKI